LLDSFGLVLGWIGQGCGDTSLHDFVPPSHLHELDFMISYGIVYVQLMIFVLDLSLFWFMMKHRGRCFDTMLGWFYWLCYPPCLGVTRGDHVSRPAMENMIYTMMMMINMSTDGSPTTPLIFLPVGSTKAHHIQATQSMGDGKPLSP
jgi:hypothetical protein